MDPSTTTIHVSLECGDVGATHRVDIHPDGTREVFERYSDEDDGIVTLAMLAEAAAIDLERGILGR